MTRQTTRPLPVSAGLAVLAGRAAVLFVANGPVQRTALAIGLAGVVAVWLGLEAFHRGHGLVGVLAGAGGIGGGVVGGIAVGLAVLIHDVGIDGLPIAALSILLSAGVVLSVALYN